jgi:hypothetical protein
VIRHVSHPVVPLVAYSSTRVIWVRRFVFYRNVVWCRRRYAHTYKPIYCITSYATESSPVHLNDKNISSHS